MSIQYEKNEERPEVRIRAAGRTLRIFQMTDLHYHDFLPEKWNELWAFRDLIREHGADLVVNTGDFFNQSDPRMAATISTWFDRIVGPVCPWCLALGNHDQDADCPDSKGRLWQIEAMLASLPRSLFRRSHDHISAYPGPEFPEELAAMRVRGDCKIPQHGVEAAWDGFLGGNCILRIENGQNLVWEVFILNSRNYFHVPPKARRWMSLVHTAGCPAVVFLHVPPRAWEALISRGGCLGQAAEKVCFEGEDGSFHRFLVEEMRDVVACFSGHDHVNDCAGVLDSILYVYGRKSGVNGYGGYVTVPRPRDVEKGKTIRMGGTVITLDLSGAACAGGLCADGSLWSYRGVGIRHVEMPAALYQRDRASENFVFP